MGLQSIIHTIEKESLMYFKVLALVYADATVNMVESADELQCALIEFQIYCSQWKMKVKVDKNILVFTQDPMLKTK